MHRHHQLPKKAMNFVCTLHSITSQLLGTYRLPSPQTYLLQSSTPTTPPASHIQKRRMADRLYPVPTLLNCDPCPLAPLTTNHCRSYPTPLRSNNRRTQLMLLHIQGGPKLFLTEWLSRRS